ncbi:lasso peptide biosynthesis B2 protein [Streptomyces pactum]|uniref:Lasso peptide biosynthesis B2 protein n=1 Tax=Streptomyces pactum TaxID=68249 RepID=A0ABS0NRD8_9ACTN|nr:lasso peptide biosynthesis B2 protein [Streptomyces pactum]MBH5337768.1 lasso peptide biosynthesis B2 protein [Streptomyces pactum]
MGEEAVKVPAPTRYTRTALAANVGVVVNYRTGTTVVLTGDALSRWLESLEHSQAPAPVTVRPSEISWGTSESSARLETPAPPPWPWRLAATALLLTTLAARHLGRERTRFGRLVRLAEAGRSLPPPTREHASLAVRSVRWVARAFPARVACLEESTTAALLLAVGGRGGAWRHGIATDPIRMHAWICDSHDQPVEEPVQTGDYSPINGPANVEEV